MRKSFKVAVSAEGLPANNTTINVDEKNIVDSTIFVSESTWRRLCSLSPVNNKGNCAPKMVCTDDAGNHYELCDIEGGIRVQG